MLQKVFRRLFPLLYVRVLLFFHLPLKIVFICQHSFSGWSFPASISAFIIILHAVCFPLNVNCDPGGYGYMCFLFHLQCPPAISTPLQEPLSQSPILDSTPDLVESLPFQALAVFHSVLLCACLYFVEDV